MAYFITLTGVIDYLEQAQIIAKAYCPDPLGKLDENIKVEDLVYG